jgi:hypothetical protein
MTDNFRAYKGATEGYAKHESVNHSAKEYVRGNAHTNEVEGYFSLLKRGVMGTFLILNADINSRKSGAGSFQRWSSPGFSGIPGSSSSCIPEADGRFL